MKIFYRILFAIILFPLVTFAQSNYKAGYIVNLKGDTTQGYINYKEWDSNPQSIAFKKETNQGSPEIFTVKSISAFAISGQVYYERYVISATTDAVDVTSLTVKLDTSYRIDTVFLKVLNTGRYINLYSYKDDIKSRFYLLEKGQSHPYELIFHAFYRQDDPSAIQYVKRFHTQLLHVSEKNEINNDHLSREISEATYSETELTSIAQSINGNTSRQFTPQSVIGIRWLAGASIDYSNMKFTGGFLLANAPASKNTTPTVSAGIDIFPNKAIQRFYMRSELSFSYGQYKFVYTDPNAAPTGTTGSLNFKQYSATITPQLVYNIYNRDKLKVFIDFGAAINFSTYSRHAYMITYDLFAPRIQDKYPEFYRAWVAFPVKAGIEISRKFEVYFSYMPSTTNAVGDLRDPAGFSMEHTAYFTGFNYFFGVK